MSQYAASKKANELIAHTYSQIYRLPATGLRLFTVYGPWKQSDMSLFLFTKAMLACKMIQVFNNGEMVRDFTFDEDIVKSLAGPLDWPTTPNPAVGVANPNPATS